MTQEKILVIQWTVYTLSDVNEVPTRLASHSGPHALNLDLYHHTDPKLQTPIYEAHKTLHISTVARATGIHHEQNVGGRSGDAKQGMLIDLRLRGGGVLGVSCGGGSTARGGWFLYWSLPEANQSCIQLLEIQRTNDNNKCVDCNAPSPQWVCRSTTHAHDNQLLILIALY
jgi:hypothetical protein